MNTPNKLTLLRFILVFPFVVLMLGHFGGDAGKWISLAIFCAASATDALDGYIARKYDLVTDFGKFMDPLADKPGLFSDDLSDGTGQAPSMGGPGDHRPGVHHQRVPPGGFR